MKKAITFKFLLVISLLCLYFPSIAQNITKVMGTVINSKTKEPIPFVNVYFKGTSAETTTDFDGRYSIETKDASDTLIAQYLGYEPQKVFIVKNKFQFIDFELISQTYSLSPVIILPGENPAEILLKKIINNKAYNNKQEYDAYQYEAYTKIQVDANNFREDIKNLGIMKPFKFIFENTDTSIINGKAYLPVFLTESISEVYYRKEPRKKLEKIYASQISGMDNKSMAQLLGDSYIDINLYENYIELFEKNFVSPVANFGLAYYKYYLIDSGFMDNRWCYELNFKPRRKQELTFSGKLWIADTSFAIMKADIRMSEDANVNIINEIVIYQEFSRVDSIHYMPVKEAVVADVNITEEATLGFYIHKTSSYRDFLINKTQPDEFYNNPLDIEVCDSANLRSKDFWITNRPEGLTHEENNIYKLTDTIQTIPAFRFYKDLFSILVTGYKVVGLFEIGPYMSIYSFNQLEGNRFRIGGRTSNKFSKKLMINAHVAYGTKDDKIKYGADFWYLYHKNPNRGFGIMYKYDLEQLGQSQNAFREDFLINSIMRRSPQDKLSMVEEIKAFWEHEWFVGLSNRIYLTHRTLWPVGATSFNFEENGIMTSHSSITTSEVRLNTRFAYREKILSGEFERVSLGTKYPIFEAGYGYGIKQPTLGDFEYHRLELRIRQWFNVGSFGWSKYYIEGGKIWGKLPFPLLKLHEANETFAFDEYAANTMNYYEFVSDEFVSIYYTHHFDGLFFNKVPLFRKLRWREVVSGRCVMGKLSDSNKSFGIYPENSFTLDKPFYEAGCGIENILTVLRFDAMWRLAYLDNPNVSRFSIMFSADFNF